MLSTGESGGTYQTIGIVRYSGCSGSAIRQRLHIAYTGERRAASIQSSAIPSRRACSRTSGSSGSSIRSSWASSRSCSSATEAAASTRSVSIRTMPRWRSRPTQVSEQTVGSPASIRG